MCVHVYICVYEAHFQSTQLNSCLVFVAAFPLEKFHFGCFVLVPVFAVHNKQRVCSGILFS